MEVNTSLIETDVLLSLVRANERQACEIKQLQDKVDRICELIEDCADHCIVEDRFFQYASVSMDELCFAVGKDFRRLNEYVEKAKKTDV